MQSFIIYYEADFMVTIQSQLSMRTNHKKASLPRAQHLYSPTAEHSKALRYPIAPWMSRYMKSAGIPAGNYP